MNFSQHINSKPCFLTSFFRWILCDTTTIIILTPAILICRFSYTFSKNILDYWCKLQLKIFGIEVKITDRNSGEYSASSHLFVLLNQTSLSETFIINHALPIKFHVFMNLGYALLPLVGWHAWICGGITIVRKWRSQIRSAMKKTIKLLK